MTTAPVSAQEPPPPAARPLDSFDELTAAHRPALLAHCYRMLGSIDDAEDAVQEALARAWRARDTYREDISARAWLYRIATNVCLDAIERRRRTPGATPAGRMATTIEPVPAELFADVSAEPHARYDAHESISMAFLATLQLLTPSQRAVLILRDVLGWHASEVAELLDVSVSAANSSLHRARGAIAERRTDTAARSSGLRALLDRYVRAWESADIPGLVALLREDAVVTMPPGVTVDGAPAIGRFLEDVVFADERRIRMRPVETNGGPGYLILSKSRDYPEFGPYAVVLLGIDERGPAVTSMTVFAEPRVVARFLSGSR